MFERSKRRKREPTLHAHNAGCMLDPALVASNSLDRRSTTEIPQHRTPGCTNLQFCFNDHECMRKSKMRKTNVHAQTTFNWSSNWTASWTLQMHPGSEINFCCRSDSCQSSTRCSCQREKALINSRHITFQKWEIPRRSKLRSHHITSLHLSEVRTSEAVHLLIPRLLHQGSHPRTQSWSLHSELEHSRSWIQLTPCSWPCPQKPKES